MRRLAHVLIIVSLSLVAPLATASAAGEHLHWFKKGQCTRYAYQKRPDIVDQGYARNGFLHWDGWEWSGHAKASGFKVDGKPRKGAIAWRQRNVVGSTCKRHP